MKDDTVKYIMKRKAFLIERRLDSVREAEKLLKENSYCFSMFTKGGVCSVKYCAEKDGCGLAGELYFFDCFGVGSKNAVKIVSDALAECGVCLRGVWMSDTSLALFLPDGADIGEDFFKKSFRGI